MIKKFHHVSIEKGRGSTRVIFRTPEASSENDREYIPSDYALHLLALAILQNANINPCLTMSGKQISIFFITYPTE